jgi:hypothetical protein
MFRNYASPILAGKINDDWAQQALKTQQVVSACMNGAKRSA